MTADKIYLVGLMGAGKTTLAQALARRLGWQAEDVDALIENSAGLPLLKVQVVGPMTLAAALELPTLSKLLTDHGALRELSESLAKAAGARTTARFTNLGRSGGDSAPEAAGRRAIRGHGLARRKAETRAPR